MRLLFFEISWVGFPKTSNQKIKQYLKEGRTIFAIKEYKKKKRCSITEAKDYIFELREDMRFNGEL